LPANLCQTPQNAPNFDLLEQLRATNVSSVYARMKVHVIRKESSPTGGQTVEGVNLMMNNLYSIFDEEGIFFAWDGNINYINSDYYYSMNDSKAEELINNYNSDTAIDLFLVDDTNSLIAYTQGVGVSTALVFGGYLFRSINGKGGFTTMTRSGFIAHLMGHVLNLWDTHYGSPYMAGGGCPEFVDGSNSTICGDYITDTPADPGLYFGPYGFNVNENCVYEPLDPNNPPLDPNEEEYDPDTRNYMSLTPFSCMDSFTNEQSKFMKNAISNLEQFNTINLTNIDHTYIRTVDDCFVCGTKDFIVHTNLDINDISVFSTNNIQTQIFPIDNTSFTVKVSSLVAPNSEGSQGSFSLVSPTGSSLVVAKQNVWVGKPQTIPNGTLSGTGDDDIPIYPGSGAYHVLGNLQQRFGGFEYVNWEYPEPNAELEQGGTTSNGVWDYLEYNKFFMLEGSYSGSHTGWVRGYGINPCGVGEYENNNEICVKNYGDGAPECDPQPQPIIYYPNPANSILEVDLSLQDYKIFNVVIYDETQTIRKSEQSTNIVKSLNVIGLENGTYYLHIYDGSALILSKILIINH